MFREYVVLPDPVAVCCVVVYLLKVVIKWTGQVESLQHQGSYIIGHLSPFFKAMS